MPRVRHTVCALALALPLSGLAHADVVDAWNTIATPAPPALHPVTIADPAHTALLLLDFDVGTCNLNERPDCVASLPAVAGLLTEARAAKLMTVYSLTSTGSLAGVPPAIAARGDETVVRSGVDKFLNTDLEAALKARGIQTVIVTGTVAHGAVLYTASEAALRGFKVIVPTDGMSSKESFGELSAAWVLANAPAGVGRNVTLTRAGMIGFPKQ
ncbi:isochorismatase family protein [Burkholderia sp. Ac-20379]|uniref:isochorismatase family protein n=1 Tax=Burkholderia sp. Ac-20379 TaxID=2703900 RepID=UPI00197FA5B2|nr:isochorismatase family protein [Burkholderia sp. Ac-20379]MBN3727119.1 cysteine hydrolase [Burkholderia sp. Ac-20379]